MAFDPSQAAKDWSAKLGSAGEKIKRGVQNTASDPMELAAQAVDRQVAGVQAAAASGKTQARLRAVGKAGWQKAMLEKGVGRIASGATAGLSKMQNYLQAAKPHYDAGQAMLQNSPRGTKEQNRARMNQWFEHMSNLKYKQ